MKKTIVKKLSMIIIIIILMMFLVTLPLKQTDKASGYDYDLSNYWDGSNLTISPLSTVSYESKYQPYSTIYNNSSAIDPEKIYVISTALDLYNLSEDSMGTYQDSYLSLDYVLGTDINYDAASQQGYLLHPIGFETTHPFTGTFDGQGFQISNLYFDPISTSEMYTNDYKNDLMYYSLFSRVSSTGIVKNLGLVNPTMIQPINWGIMSFASPLVGLNEGLVEFVYVIDDRTTQGISVDGDFHLAGIISVNQGTFRNSFLSAECVKSEAVSTNISTRTVLTFNTGTLSNVYFDDTVYFPDLEAGDLGVGLVTADFQNPTYFGAGWFLNDYYSETNPQGQLNNTYPILKGIETDLTGQFLISNATDLHYMSTLLSASSYFRSKTYVLTQDIDMNQLSSGSFRPSATLFSGTFTSAVISDPVNTTLYTHSMTEGAVDRYSIIGLSGSTATVIGTYTSYGLFGALSGTVKDINIINGQILATDTASHIAKTRNCLGFITGNLSGGTINNAHVLGTIGLTSGIQIGKTYIGGLVGYGYGTIINSTASGSIDGGIHPYIENSNESAIGGLIGFSYQMKVSQSINAMDINGIGFSATNTSVLYAGGVIGTGITNGLTEIMNLGDVNSHATSGFIYKIYLGGIVGLHTKEMLTVSRTNNQGNVNVLIKGALVAKIAGYGNIIGSTNFNLYSLANEGLISNSYVDGGGANSLGAAVLETVKLEMAGVVITEGTNAYFQGLFNKANQTVDLSVCYHFAAVILCNNNYYDNGGTYVYDDVSSSYGPVVTVVQSNNEGNINAITTGEVTWYQIKLSGNSLGKNIHFYQVRNSGDISVHFTYQTTKLMENAPTADGVVNPYKNLKVMGLLEEVSQDKYASNLYNGGKISITMNSGLKVKFNLYIAGIGYKNANTNMFTTYGIDYTAIDIDSSVHGSIHNAINDGEIYVVGEFYGQSRVSGIVSINASILSSCFNTGNIFNQNAIKSVGYYGDGDSYAAGEFEVETGGITFLMNGQYAQIKDSANYGSVTSYSTTTSGWVNSSGIAVRNEKTENGTDYGGSPVSGSHFAKIEFSINYGNIFAWNVTNEASYAVSSESRCKAGGILGLGVLSTINVMNYGNIYSRYVASGMYAFVFFSKFSIGIEEVFIANSINYGNIRRLISTGSGTGCPFYYDSATQSTLVPTNYVDQNYVQKTSGNSEYAFGALIGKIHTGSSTGWDFDSGAYSLADVIFSYLINFDEITDIIGKTPTSNITNETLVASINQYMATVRLSDGSIYPFNRIKSYSLDTAELTGNSGRDGTTYMGIFNEAFSLRTPPTVFNFDTDQFIADYIQFIPYSKVNSTLAERIGLDVIGEIEGDEVGIYALSSSMGILNGEFIPDNVNFYLLNPHLFDEFGESITDDSWQFVINSGTETIYAKFYDGMKQLDKSIASTIFNMELVCDQDSSIVLRNPSLDQSTRMATFYVPSNSDAALGSTASQVQVYRYVEAGEGVSGSYFIPYTYNGTTGKYVGQYKRNIDGTYSSIGPYDSTGIYNLTFSTGTTRQYGGYYRSSSMYTDPNGTFYLYQYYSGRARTYTLLDVSDQLGAGYGKYRFVSGNQYVYVGPTTETTYVRTTETITLYSDNGNTFSMNLDTDSYQLASLASLQYVYNSENHYFSGNSGAGIPTAAGIYSDLFYVSTGLPVTPMSDYYGLIRVYSEAYVHDPLNEGGDPYTYSDYKIRIVRVPNQAFTAVNSLLVNGQSAIPSPIPDINDVTATANIAYKPDEANGGTANITFATINAANQSDFLPVTRFLDSLGQEVNENLYSLSGGIVTASGSFDPITGSWGPGTVTFNLSTVQALHSGAYTIEITLSASDIYHVHVYKEESPEAAVLSLDYQNEWIIVPDLTTTLQSSIPFGIYYLATDSETDIVNFSNLSTITDVNYDNITGANLPYYLGSLEISPFANINSIDFSVAMYDSYRHVYTIVYNIEAEDGTLATFTHTLLEQEVTPDVVQSYVDGNLVETAPYNVIGFERETSPTIRLDFDFSNIYFADETPLSVDSAFLGSGTATLGVDYFLETFSSYGFEAEFSLGTPVGDYEFIMDYNNSETLSTGDVLNWSYFFQTVTITKKLNNNSHLKLITFVSDTIFSGLDTVMDIVEMDDVTYQAYLNDRLSREIIVLPNSGIIYNDYLGYNAYWAIGQVQKTNLGHYTPGFTKPLGASVYRIIDENNLNDPSLQSTDLYDDFTPDYEASTFKYIHYRVYAEDYVMGDPNYNTHYTDYYIAVQDITNNIKLTFDIVLDDLISPSYFYKLFVTLDVDDLAYSTASESLFAYFYQTQTTGTHIQFESGMSGAYTVVIDLPPEFDFTIQFSSPSVSVNGHTFLIADSIIPKKYSFTITVIYSSYNPDWGQRDTFFFGDSVN